MIRLLCGGPVAPVRPSSRTPAGLGEIGIVIAIEIVWPCLHTPSCSETHADWFPVRNPACCRPAARPREPRCLFRTIVPAIWKEVGTVTLIWRMLRALCSGDGEHRQWLAVIDYLVAESATLREWSTHAASPQQNHALVRLSQLRLPAAHLLPPPQPPIFLQAARGKSPMSDPCAFPDCEGWIEGGLGGGTGAA